MGNKGPPRRRKAWQMFLLGGMLRDAEQCVNSWGKGRLKDASSYSKKGCLFFWKSLHGASQLQVSLVSSVQLSLSLYIYIYTYTQILALHPSFIIFIPSIGMPQLSVFTKSAVFQRNGLPLQSRWGTAGLGVFLDAFGRHGRGVRLPWSPFYFERLMIPRKGWALLWFNDVWWFMVQWNGLWSMDNMNL